MFVRWACAIQPEVQYLRISKQTLPGHFFPTAGKEELRGPCQRG